MVCCWCSISRRTLPSSIRLYRRALALSSPLKSQAPRIGQYAPRIVGAVANSGAWAWVADLTSLGSPRRVCPSGSLAATDFPESLWSERMVQPGSPPTTTGMRSSFAGKSGCPLFSFLSPSCPLCPLPSLAWDLGSRRFCADGKRVRRAERGALAPFMPGSSTSTLVVVRCCPISHRSRTMSRALAWLSCSPPSAWAVC